MDICWNKCIQLRVSNPLCEFTAHFDPSPPFLPSLLPVVVTDSHNFQAEINLRNWSWNPVLHFTEKESWSPQSLRDIPNMTQLVNGKPGTEPKIWIIYSFYSLLHSFPHYSGFYFAHSLASIPSSLVCCLVLSL